MHDCPYYQPQTKTRQRYMLKGSMYRGYTWIIGWVVDGKPYGVQENILLPLFWPQQPTLPIVPTNQNRLKDPTLILLLEETKGFFPNHRFQAHLLTNREIAYLRDRYHVYEWPDLFIDLICIRCGAIIPAPYDSANHHRQCVIGKCNELALRESLGPQRASMSA